MKNIDLSDVDSGKFDSVNTRLDSAEASIGSIWATVDPLTLSMSISPSVAESGTTQAPKITFSGNKTLLTAVINGSAVTSPVTFSGVKTNTTYKLDATAEGGRTATKSVSITFVAASYYGLVADLAQTAATVTALTKSVKNIKALTWSSITSMGATRLCYAYPKSFGALTSIKDANNFDYIGSYTRTEMTINSVVYYCYVLTSPAKATSLKQAYS